MSLWEGTVNVYVLSGSRQDFTRVFWGRRKMDEYSICIGHRRGGSYSRSHVPSRARTVDRPGKGWSTENETRELNHGGESTRHGRGWTDDRKTQWLISSGFSGWPGGCGMMG